MKVLIQSRENFFEMPGGDTVQILKTKEQLEKFIPLKIAIIPVVHCFFMILGSKPFEELPV